MKLSDYQVFCVDLDDTLYLERDYVLSGLSAVARYLAEEGQPASVLENWLHERFLDVGREHIFDDCLAAFNMPGSRAHIDTLVGVYRNHKPTFQFLPGVRVLLDRLSKIGRIVIVTDGLPSMQEKKCHALELTRWADRIVYCWAEQAPKPDPASLAPVLRAYSGEAVFIGDNPRHDLCMAQQLGIDAIRVRQGRFALLPSQPWVAQLEVHAISQLIDYL